jgi:hypothetical protein
MPFFKKWKESDYDTNDSMVNQFSVLLLIWKTNLKKDPFLNIFELIRD